MSPTTYRVLRAIEADTRRLASAYEPMPISDFYRPLELLRRWRTGPGRFWWSA